jgi:hypothetical protein
MDDATWLPAAERKPMHSTARGRPDLSGSK